LTRIQTYNTHIVCWSHTSNLSRIFSLQTG